MTARTSEKLLLLFRRIHGKELLAILFILLGIYFFRQDRHELRSLLPLLNTANHGWILFGIIITGVYVLLQAGLFVHSFRAIQSQLHWPTAIVLFLKQNFISVFIPGGSVATLVYLPSLLRKEKIEKHKIFQAAGLHSITGILTVILVGIPVIIYAALHHRAISGAALPLAGVSVLIVIAVVFIRAIRGQGRLHRLLLKYFPGIKQFLAFDISRRPLSLAILFSTGIEFTGIFHVYIAMLACGVAPSWEAAFMGYIVSTLFLIISPFLKGLGAVELSLVYVLGLYGYDTVTALEITLLYRVFEFWLPLASGLITWAWKGRDIFLRLLPPALIFLLGVVNIFSVLTPPIASRLHLLQSYLPLASIHATNGLVILLGLILMMTAAFLIRGLSGAWWLALLVSILSFAGHLTKALDYEEAIVALTVILVLLFTRKQYRLKSNPALLHISQVTPIATFITVLSFGAIGYYFLDKRHFGVDFTWQQSLHNAFINFFLLGRTGYHPITRFGGEFTNSLKVLGLGAWIFFFYVLIRPYIGKPTPTANAREKASFLLNQFGSSPVDHFKLDRDKLLFISAKYDGFISYKVANGFAIVLEEPVCSEEQKIPVLREFETLCRRMGLKPAFYRIDEDSLYYFAELKKKKLLIGQEGILEIKSFGLEGRQNKSLRNGVNSLVKKGYSTRIHTAPHTAELITALAAVSDEWLSHFDKTELVFSQGMFDTASLTNEDVIALHDANGRIVAFLNVIPDYTPDECTYDLLRRTADAPAGAMDALLIHLISYAREKGLHYINLGLAPMSGITHPETTAERVVKYAYEKIRRFRYYQGLREFKEKYASEWVNKYLLYENDFDLIQLPGALGKVMSPGSSNWE